LLDAGPPERFFADHAQPEQSGGTEQLHHLAVTLSLMGTFGIAPDLGRSRAVSCLDRRYHVYRFHQLVPEGRQHIDVFSCVLYRMF
jgi:hypothetical protein